MILTAWRICHKDYAGCAFNGEGTFRIGGRWNSPGRYIVYTSDSLALASREYLAGIPLAELVIPTLVYFEVEIEQTLIELLDTSRLPKNWNKSRTSRALRAIGDEWYDTKRTLVLRVPSAVIPVGSNFLINRKHPDFKKLKPGKAERFSYDERTVEMLTKAMVAEALERKKLITVRKSK